MKFHLFKLDLWAVQARTLEWVAFPFSRGSSPPRDRAFVTCISYTASGFLSARPPGKPLACSCGWLTFLDAIAAAQPGEKSLTWLPSFPSSAACEESVPFTPREGGGTWAQSAGACPRPDPPASPQAGSEALRFSALALGTHTLGEHQEPLVAPVCPAGLGRPLAPVIGGLAWHTPAASIPRGRGPHGWSRAAVGRPAAGAVPRCSGHPSSRGDGFSVLNPPLFSQAPACHRPAWDPSEHPLQRGLPFLSSRARRPGRAGGSAGWSPLSGPVPTGLLCKTKAVSTADWATPLSLCGPPHQ